MEKPQKILETELPHDPATALLGVRLKESKSVHHRDRSIHNRRETIHAAKRQGQPDVHQLHTDTAGVSFGRKEE